MVERDLAKVEVAGSKPVSRSSFFSPVNPISRETGRLLNVGRRRRPWRSNQNPHFIFRIDALGRTNLHQNAELLGSITGVKLSSSARGQRCA